MAVVLVYYRDKPLGLSQIKWLTVEMVAAFDKNDTVTTTGL